MDWSPQDAMQAYLATHSAAAYSARKYFREFLLTNSLRGRAYRFSEFEAEKEQERRNSGGIISRKEVIEPKCTEFISPLAAGKRAKLMLQVTTQPNITPLTMPLAAAAKQTGGRLVCILLNQYSQQQHVHKARSADLLIQYDISPLGSTLLL